MWNKITDPFQNYNSATVEVWECLKTFNILQGMKLLINYKNLNM